MASVAAMIVGVVIGVVFVQRQKALADPLIDLSLFKSVAFSASLAINIVGFFVAFGTFLFIAQHAARARNEPAPGGTLDGAIRSGIHCRVDAGTGAGAPNAAHARHRMRFGVAAAGFVILTQIGRTQGPSIVVTAYVILSLGLSPVFTMATDLIVGTAPPERAGMAAALSETNRIRWCAGHCDPW